MRKQRPTADQLASLIAQPHFGQPREAVPSTDPIQPTPMVVAVDEIDVYDHNPRQLANDKYEEIKASIRASGMDQTLTITRRPGAPRYMIAAGGNTRLQAAKALWKETGDERYRSIHCLFRPWEGDTHTLVAHLKENDVRGDLSFIDRARGLTQLKGLIETERGESLSLREYAAYLGEQGYSVSHPVLISVGYAVKSLEGAIPAALGAGMSRAQVDRIRKLHKAFVTAWASLKIPDNDAGESLFVDLLSRHDDDVIDLELLHRDAVNELSVSADCDVQHAAMLYGAAIDGRDLGNLVEHVNSEPVAGSSAVEDDADTVLGLASSPQSPTEPQAPNATPPQARTVTPIRRAAPDPSDRPAPPIHGAPNPVEVLRHEAFQLADAAAQMLGCDGMVTRIDTGLGFLVGPVPAEIRESIPITQRPALLCAWWLLVTVCEQFASHGMAADAMPADWQDTPVGEAMRKAAHIEHWQSRMAREKRAEALLAVPYMPASNYAAYGLHRVTGEFFDTWTALIATTRRIYEAKKGQPWA